MRSVSAGAPRARPGYATGMHAMTIALALPKRAPARHGHMSHYVTCAWRPASSRHRATCVTAASPSTTVHGVESSQVSHAAVQSVHQVMIGLVRICDYRIGALSRHHHVGAARFGALSAASDPRPTVLAPNHVRRLSCPSALLSIAPCATARSSMNHCPVRSCGVLILRRCVVSSG